MLTSLQQKHGKNETFAELAGNVNFLRNFRGLVNYYLSTAENSSLHAC